MSKPITKKNREHLDSLVIGSGHTIMAGYIPTSIEHKPSRRIFINGLKLLRSQSVNLVFGEEK